MEGNSPNNLEAKPCDPRPNSGSKWKFLIQEYELVKQKRHPKFRFAADFYRFQQTHRQTFFKYYHRFRQSEADHAVVPQKRGPKSGKAGGSTGLLSSRGSGTGSKGSIAMRVANF